MDIIDTLVRASKALEASHQLLQSSDNCLSFSQVCRAATQADLANSRKLLQRIDIVDGTVQPLPKR